MVHALEGYATAVALAVRDIDERMILVTGHGPLVAKVGTELGLRINYEISADRRYAESGQLILQK